MACIDKIAADILNSCDTIPRGGFEKIAWAINREDIATITYDSTVENLVEALDTELHTRAYSITAVKKEMNAGFDLVTGDDIPDTFLNYFSFKPYEKTAEAIANLDSMNDLVIIAELKGLKTEGCFVIYGLEKGLYKSTGTVRQNDSNGLPIYEMQSMEGQGERYSRFVFWDTDYATSKAAIEALTQEFGPELHTDANAASDPNGNEADATTGWTSNNLTGTGANVFESQNSVVNEGSYALHAEANDTPTASAYCQLEITVEDGEDYLLSYDRRHVGSGGDWIVQPEGVTVDTIVNTETAFESKEFVVTAAGVAFRIRIIELNVANDGGVYIDNLSLRKVL